MQRPVYCDKCLKEIEYRDDLVTVLILWVVAPYHGDCYVREMKGARGFFLGDHPLNSFSGNVLFWMAIVATILFAIFGDGLAKYAGLLAVVPVSYRAFSYFVYERQLQK
ncbi:hypothetical protein [Thalassobacillus hwangdonensis]|uniref:Uncharacterized protein n=1 Tax=Thalassobacillus hwangdonensis TaxID=546108 RepID=A0ABW3L3G9_9BACI